MLLTPDVFENAMELGLIYGLVALALFLSYSMLNVCDLSTDGCYTLGCAVGSVVAIAGHPVLAIFAAMGAGILSGFVTALLQTKLGVESLLAGIIVNTGLYSVNIVIMGRATLNLNNADTVFTFMKDLLANTPLASHYKIVVGILFLVIVVAFLLLFLGTRLGLSIRATGSNSAMVKASSINPALMIIVGLCLSNAITALAGCLIGEYNKTCDINMGTGMVTIALASLIIGETVIRRRTIWGRAIAVIAGSCIYRLVVALALRFNLPATSLKLISAIIVAVAISAPNIADMIDVEQKRYAAVGKSFYRLLTVSMLVLTLVSLLAAQFIPALGAVAYAVAVLAVASAVWAFRKDRKAGAEK